MKRRDGTPYLGSVLFFKHLIIAVFVMAVLIPTGLFISKSMQNESLKVVLSASSSLNFTALKTGDIELELQSQPQVPAVEVPTWQAACPDLYAAPADRGTVNQEHSVYLTFDDGPSARTPEILDILDGYQVKGTFFVVGKQDEQSRQWMRQIVDRGHAIGMHSFTHDYKRIYASVESFLEDYEQIYQLIYETTGVAPGISRFPGGSVNGYNSPIYQQIISELIRRGFVYFDWNTVNGDATGEKLSPAQLQQNALSGLGSQRTTILMHDSEQKIATVQALPGIIEGYKEAGYAFEVLTPETVPVVFTYKE